ncbi:MAG TPA: sortase [Rubrobacteraceae bacterium]|nr:sortase [Rubrobacteraceae bacterium]
MVLFASLVIVVLGGLMFFGIDPSQKSAEVGKIERVQPLAIAEAPKAVAKPKPPEPVVVEVPDIPYNATEKEAEKMLASKGLELGEVKKEANDEYDKGGVFWQDPLPGVRIKEGEAVGITLSAGPKKEEAGDKKGSKDDPPDPATQDLYLTVPKMGLYDNYVANTADEAVMDSGAIKLPSTGFPWQPNANTYVAAHVLGYSGTGSYMQFAGLPSMTYGDEILLSDADGTVYKYAVSEILTVTPQDNWVTNPVAGKDMVTLQTCVNPPYYDQRLVVRAERVGIDEA